MDSQSTDKQWLPIVISISIAIILLAVGMLYLPNNIVFHGVRPQPFLIFGALLSAYYGFRTSVFTSIFYTLIYAAGVYFQVDHEAVESFFSYEFLSLPIALQISCIPIGELTQRRLDSVSLQKDSAGEKEKVINYLKSNNEVLKRDNHKLKERLVSKLETAGKLFETGKVLLNLNTQQMYDDFLKILEEQISATHSAIYLFTSQHKLKLNCKIAPEDFEIQPIINLDKEKSSLIAKAISKGGVANLKDQNFQKVSQRSAPILTCIIGKPENALGVLVIWKMPFLNYIPSNFKLVEIYTEWLSYSMETWRNINSLKELNFLNSELNIYKYNYFKKRFKDEFDRASRFSLPLTLLKIKLKHSIDSSDQNVLNLKRILSETLQENIRSMDCLSESEQIDTWNLILPICPESETQDICRRITKTFADYLPTNNESIKAELEFLETNYTPGMQSSEDMISSMREVNIC